MSKCNLPIILLLALLLVACGKVKDAANDLSITPVVSPETTSQVTPTPVGDCNKIALVITDGVNSDIHTVCPDGSNLVNITNEWLADFDPAWSPDGRRIAFASTRAGAASQIYIMDADGKYPQRLTEDYDNDHPIWLPDGTRVAFRTHDGNGSWWWRTYNLDTHEITKYSVPSYDFFFQTPAWSPDGLYLAYMSLVEQQERNDGSSQIHVKNLVDGSDTALTNDIWANIKPTWSHDGQRIAFFSERDGTYNLFGLYIMNRDGSGLRSLTKPEFSEEVMCTWSPDGSEIAVGNSAVMRNVFIVDVMTGEVRTLLELPEGITASSPAWQP